MDQVGQKLKNRHKKGFTLIELLVVVFILSIIAGGVIISLGNAHEATSFQLSQNEIIEIKKAILQFKQDTGYLPKQGVFSLGIDCTSPSDTSEQHFCSPANLGQLYEEPVDSSSVPIMPWNINTGRGWRGPYLTRLGEGVVDVGNNINPHMQGINGDPEGGTLLADVRGVADPFIADKGVCPSSEAQCFLGFSTVAGDDTYNRWGRPYLVFGLETVNNTDDDVIVGMGVNASFDQGAGDDIVIDLFK